MLLSPRACVLASLLAPACAACAPDAPEDAGHDGGHDAGTDAGFDAGRDAGPPDAGFDAGHDGGPDDPGWAPWTQVERCTFERATFPERLPTIGWAPCEEAPGCQRVVPPAPHVARAWFDGGRGYLQSITVEGNQRTIVLAAVDGPTLAAWRYRIAQDGFTCRLDLGVGDGFVGFVLSYFVDDPRGRVDQVFHTEIGHLAELEVDPIAVIAPGVTSQRVSVSAELVAFWTGAWAVGVDVPSGRVAFLNEPLGGIPQNVTVVGDQVFWEDWADLVRVASATLDVTASLFHRADPGDVKGFRTDGVDFAWFEGYDRHPDGRYDRLELWTAPFTRDPAALSPRRVRAMEIRSGSMYGGGWYVVQRGAPNGYDVVNVRDGSLRRIAAGGGVMPLYVAEHEILFSTVRWDPNTLPLVEEP